MAFWSSVKRELKKADLALSGTLTQSANIVKEALNRSLSLPDLVGQAFGAAPIKNLRLRVIILKDEDSSPLVDTTEVLPSIEAAQLIFESQARTKIIPFQDRFVEVLEDAAPAEALDVHCDFQAWKEDFLEAGSFFEAYLRRNAASALTGYASPITAFIVRSIHGKSGCSLGPLADYVTVAAYGLQCWGSDDEGRPLARILAHEIGHACGLWHIADTSNLMHPGGPGINLNTWQKAIIRNSRHVTYF